MLSCIAISCTQNLEEGDQDNGGNLLHRVAIGLTEPELLSIAYDSDNDLSEEAATDILSDFIAANNVSGSSMSTFSLTNKFTINEVNNATRSANKDHVTFYEYETENQPEKKKALVCGDKRFPAVVAYIDSYNKTSILPADIMLANAKQYVLSTISQIKHYEDSLRVQTIDKVRRIKPFTGDFKFKDFEHNIFVYENTTRGWAVTPGGTEMAKIGPLTMTQWDQISPYNLYADPTTGTADEGTFTDSYDNRYPAGCVVTAMAQIAAYLKPSMPSIDWTLANVHSVSNSDKTSERAKAVASVFP